MSHRTLKNKGCHKMKKICFLLVFSIVFLFFFSCELQSITTAEVPDSQVIKTIEFAQPSASYESEFKKITKKLKEEDKGLFGRELSVYQIVPRKTNEKFDKNLLRVFEMKDYKVNEKDVRGVINYISDSVFLSIYPRGPFSYFDGKKAMEDGTPFTMSDQEAIQQAKDFLQSKSLLPEGFIPREKLDISTLENAVPESETTPITLAKHVIFERKIDGYDVVGNSKINISLNRNGIFDVSSFYSDYELYKKIKCISLEEAIQRITSSSSTFLYELEKIDGPLEMLTLTEAEIVYHDSSLGEPERNTHIQPCYRFTGTVSDGKGNVVAFHALVPALPASETVDNPPLE